MTPFESWLFICLTCGLVVVPMALIGGGWQAVREIKRIVRREN